MFDKYGQFCSNGHIYNYTGTEKFELPADFDLTDFDFQLNSEREYSSVRGSYILTIKENGELVRQNLPGIISPSYDDGESKSYRYLDFVTNNSEHLLIDDGFGHDTLYWIKNDSVKSYVLNNDPKDKFGDLYIRSCGFRTFGNDFVFYRAGNFFNGKDLLFMPDFKKFKFLQILNKEEILFYCNGGLVSHNFKTGTRKYKTNLDKIYSKVDPYYDKNGNLLLLCVEDGFILFTKVNHYEEFSFSPKMKDHDLYPVNSYLNFNGSLLSIGSSKEGNNDFTNYKFFSGIYSSEDTTIIFPGFTDLTYAKGPSIRFSHSNHPRNAQSTDLVFYEKNLPTIDAGYATSEYIIMDKNKPIYFIPPPNETYLEFYLIQDTLFAIGSESNYWLSPLDFNFYPSGSHQLSLSETAQQIHNHLITISKQYWYDINEKSIIRLKNLGTGEIDSIILNLSTHPEIFAAKDGSIDIFYNDSLFLRYKDKQIQKGNLNLVNGSSHKTHLFFQDLEGCYWIGTSEGIFCIEINQNIAIRKAFWSLNNFDHEEILDVQDNLLNVLLLTENSIYSIDKNSLSNGNSIVKKIVDKRSINKKDLTRFSKLGSGEILVHNLFWSSIISIPEDFGKRFKEEPPKLLLKSFKLDTIYLAGKHPKIGLINPSNLPTEFEYFENNFEFIFTALEFRDNSDLSYRYKVTNVYDQWEYTKNPVIALRGLNPGTYTLQVQSIYRENYSELFSYTFFVHAPWWEKTWWYLFQALFFSTLLLITYFASKNGASKFSSFMTTLTVIIVFESFLMWTSSYINRFSHGIPIINLVGNVLLAFSLKPVDQFVEKYFERRKKN
ncbi:MAG: hypothetical protein R2780_11185 [Crocinitomicaceae bacterium]|nr:hypothetical protein [Crocinitomicaceae bacterium]